MKSGSPSAPFLHSLFFRLFRDGPAAHGQAHRTFDPRPGHEQYPADCVHNPYDSDGISDRLTWAHDAGKEVSLYFHPAMDLQSMTVQTDGDAMTFSYDEQTGILARIIRLTDSWGYRFGTFD